MKRDAVDSAEACLARAKEHLHAMAQATSLEVFKKFWPDFLTMANRVYVKLEQGAKDNGPSSGWYGRKKNERRTDPLLQYVKQARDADEHGLAKVTGRSPGQVGIRFTEDRAVWSGTIRTGPDGVTITPASENRDTPMEITAYPSDVTLVPVVNYATQYDVPTVHLGNPVPLHPVSGTPHPITVGELMIKHLETVIHEASALAQ